MAYTGLNAPSVTFRLECHPARRRPRLRRPQQHAGLGRALQRDRARRRPRAADARAAERLAPAGTSGAEPLDVAATDASGVKSLSVSAGATQAVRSPAVVRLLADAAVPGDRAQSVALDTSKLDDGTYELKAVATDAADQAGTATATLKVDRHAPEPPQDLAVRATPTGRWRSSGRTPTRGRRRRWPRRATRSATRWAHCVRRDRRRRRGIARVASSPSPRAHVVRVWLQDEAGNADRANAATLTVDPARSARRGRSTSTRRSSPPPAAPGFRVTSARRSGSTLTLSGTIARAATARISAKVAARQGVGDRADEPDGGALDDEGQADVDAAPREHVLVTLTFAGQAASARRRSGAG